MSSALAAARKRRGAPQPDNSFQPNTQQQQQQQQQQNVNANGLTLPQVISIIDKRLIQLETFMKSSKEQNTQNNATVETSSNSFNEQFNQIISEYNSRFELLAEEIGNLKDIVLKLQSYTMEVNKSLMEERIHILSDLGTNENITYEKVENQELSSIDLKNLVKQEFNNNESFVLESSNP